MLFINKYLEATNDILHFVKITYEGDSTAVVDVGNALGDRVLQWGMLQWECYNVTMLQCY